MILRRFARWFASEGGVYQTLIIVMAIVAIEAIWPHADPSGLRFLYWLTVYSAVTQPILAYVAQLSEIDQAIVNRRVDKALSRIERLEKRILSDVEHR